MDYPKGIWDRDYRGIFVSPETLRKDAERYGLPARLALGRIKTSEQLEEDRKRIMSKPLP